MSLTAEKCQKYAQILKEELVPALGCTEPTCIAYVSAKARQVLGMEPNGITIESSGNIIKNVKGAVVPNTGNLRGIEAAAVVGVFGGDPDRELEVLSAVKQEDLDRAMKAAKNGFCKVKLLDTPANLHVIATVTAEGGHYACVEIVHTHTNIVRIEKDGKKLLSKPFNPNDFNQSLTDRGCLNVKDILEYADKADISPIRDVIETQIRCNTKISEEGLSHPYGACVGATLRKYYGDDVKVRARAAAAAGSDARMSGCILPVVINSGSGNQGMTVSLPVIEYAKELKVSHEKLLRALVLSNLLATHQKTAIGRLSAYCGAVSAACGAGAAITYLCGGSYEQICLTIINSLGNVSGMVCDGAKPSCAAKIASAVDAAIMGHCMAMQNKGFSAGEGLITGDIESTLRNIGRLGHDGMRETDHEILEMMIGE